MEGTPSKKKASSHCLTWALLGGNTLQRKPILSNKGIEKRRDGGTMKVREKKSKKRKGKG